MLQQSAVSFMLLLAVNLSSCSNAKSRVTAASDIETVGLKPTVDKFGAIVRGDVSKKEIALVFTGDTFGDGGGTIRRTLLENSVHASFFLTGNFYANSSFTKLVHALKDDGHYLGPHSDKHLLYADWTNRDSTLVTESQFKRDILANYERMARLGIAKVDAPYFLPAYEWYNRDIVSWASELGLQLVNFSSGTLSNADYTWPGMGSRYRPSDLIYRSIIDCERKDVNGLNGFILLVHIGTDPRRTDKFYDKLDSLINDLKRLKYTFVRIDSLLGSKARKDE